MDTNSNRLRTTPPQPSDTPVTQKKITVVLVAIAFLLLGGAIGILIDRLFISKDSSHVESTTAGNVLTPSPFVSQQNDKSEISIRVNPYRLDEENEQLIATFQIENLNKVSKPSTVTYWTDKNGACQAETQPFNELIKIPVNGATFSFFQLTDVYGNTSEIYASSHNPIFQCGKLAE